MGFLKHSRALFYLFVLGMLQKLSYEIIIRVPIGLAGVLKVKDVILNRCFPRDLLKLRGLLGYSLN